MEMAFQLHVTGLLHAVQKVVGQWAESRKDWSLRPSAVLITQGANDEPSQSSSARSDTPESQEPATPASPPPQPPRKNRWRWLWLLALALVMGSIGVALGMFAASWANRRTATPAPPPQASATQAPVQPTATPVPPASPTPLPPSLTPSPQPATPTPAATATPTLAATATEAFPDTPHGCVAIVKVGDTFYNLIGRFYGVSSDSVGFRAAYHFPAIAYTYAPPAPDALWKWEDDFFRLSVPTSDDAWKDFEEKLNTLPVLGMGILMPQLDRQTCLTHDGLWVPIAGLPDWAIYGNQPAPTPTP